MRRFTTTTLVLAIVLAATPTTARAATPLERLALYLPNRVLDLLDVLTLSVSVGPGFGVMAYGTRALTLGYNNLTVVRVGVDKRKGPAWDEEVLEYGVGPFYVHEGEPVSPTEIRMTLHPLMAGLELGFDPLSLLDFVTGFVFIDLEGDDTGTDAGTESGE